jgi:superfamily II DNA or RNA helicase
MISLYPHQEQFINNIRQAFRHNDYIVGQAATGFGKTICGAFMAKSATARNKRIFFSVHRRELITQTAKSFDKFGITYGYIAAGYPNNFYAHCQIISIDTAKNRLESMPPPDIAVIDEAHLALSPGWLKVIDHWKSQGAKILFLTATPWRLSGEGLGDIADAMVFGPPVQWLIENGYLSEYKYYSPAMPDLGDVHTRMGDFVRSELGEAMDKPTITGDCIKHYRRLADNSRAVAFCVSVAHSKHVADQFNAAGIPASHIDGDTPSADRKRIIGYFADGRIKVLTNVEIVTTGFDLSAQVDRDVPIETVILLRPTQSLSLYLQMVGRGLRPKDKPAIILDHAGCAMKHGLPCQERQWTLAGRDKATRSKDDDETSVMIKQCPKCYHCHTPSPACPDCGHVYEIKSRKINEQEGELQEIDPAQFRKQARMEQGQAKTVTDLVQQGYSEGRAEHIIKARQEKLALQTELYNLQQGARSAGITVENADISRMKPKKLRESIVYMKGVLSNPSALMEVKNLIEGCSTGSEVEQALDDIELRWRSGEIDLNDGDWPQITSIIAAWKDKNRVA